MIQKPEIPVFNSEREEAEWWDQHRDETAQWMQEALRSRQTASLAEVLARAQMDENARVSVGLDPSDLSRLRDLAAKKGVACETYLRDLIHEALRRDERTG